MTIDKLKAGERFKLPLSGKTGVVWELNTDSVKVRYCLEAEKTFKLEIISSKTEVERI